MCQISASTIQPSSSSAGTLAGALGREQESVCFKGPGACSDAERGAAAPAPGINPQTRSCGVREALGINPGCCQPGAVSSGRLWQLIQAAASPWHLGWHTCCHHVSPLAPGLGPSLAAALVALRALCPAREISPTLGGLGGCWNLLGLFGGWMVPGVMVELGFGCWAPSDIQEELGCWALGEIWGGIWVLCSW